MVFVFIASAFVMLSRGFSLQCAPLLDLLWLHFFPFLFFKGLLGIFVVPNPYADGEPGAQPEEPAVPDRGPPKMKRKTANAAASAAAAAAAATAADAAGAPSSPLPSSRDDTEMATTPSDESAASAAAAAANAAAAAANASAAAAAAAAVAVAAFSPEPSTGSPAREGDVIMRTRQPDVQAVDT